MDLPIVQEMRSFDTNRDDAHAILDDAADLLEKLAEALEPVAREAANVEKCKDNRPLMFALLSGFSQRDRHVITVGDLRRARAAIALAKGEMK